MLYLGVSRESRFSPHRIDGDKVIFDAVGSVLARGDDMLFKMTESEFAYDGVEDPTLFDAVFHLCRSDKALDRLTEIERLGIPVINRPDAVRNCRRVRETRLLLSSDVSFARSIITSAGKIPDSWDSFPCWIKRGDSHSIQSDDVCLVSTREECLAVMDRMERRGIDDVVLQEHIPGKICKFYGIGEGLLFRHRFLENVGEGKFGLECNNEIGMADVDVDAFKADVVKAARILDIDVYGGDAIVGPDGRAVIIDFNDWPSFFICKTDAARVIAELIRERCDR